MSTPYANIIASASQTYGVPGNLIAAVIQTESSFNPNAVSPTGAEGLMQLEPGTATSLGVTNAFDPTQNIMGGTKYLSQLINEFGGSIPLALAGYNAGPGAVRSAGGIPSYTQSYVNQIMSLYTNGNWNSTSVGSSGGMSPVSYNPSGSVSTVSGLSALFQQCQQWVQQGTSAMVYVWGGGRQSTWQSFVAGGQSDCSSFTMQMFKHFLNITIPSTSQTQWSDMSNNMKVSSNSLQPGDLVFFCDDGSGSPTHVGVYYQNNQFYNMTYSGQPLTLSSLSGSWEKQYYEGAKRYNGVSSAYFSTGSTNNAFQNITIPQTNYGVVKNSQKYGDILYGRRYRIIVANANGVALDVSDIRCTFNIQETIMQQPPISEVVLYNLNADTENSIIQEGNRVIVEAGYEGSQYGQIFDGDIVQPIRDKQDATTYRLTLRAIDGDRFINYGFVGFSLVKGQTARDQIGAIASKAKYPTQLGTISENLDGTKLTRGKVLFGMAKDYLSQIAKSQNATYYYKNGKVHLITATDYPKNTIVDLSPTSGLINVPTQSQYGVSFTAMMNPNIKINSLVHIDNSLIRAQSFEQGQPIRNLDQDGIYRVVSITYVGDTRGSDWSIQCDTVSQAGLIPGNINGNGLSTNASFNPYGS